MSDAEAAAVESLLAMRVSRAACMGRAACSESLPVRYPEWEDRGEEEDEDAEIHNFRGEAEGEGGARSRADHPGS